VRRIAGSYRKLVLEARIWPWWLSPAWLSLAFITPIYVLTLGYLGISAQTSAIRQSGFIPSLDVGLAVLGAACLIAFGLGGLGYRAAANLHRNSARIAIRRRSSGPVSEIRQAPVGSVAAYLALLCLTIIGYGFFFYGALRGGGISLALRALSGDVASTYTIRDTGHLLPGLSTLTQVGPALIVSLIVAPPKHPKWLRIFTLSAFAVVGLAALRTVIWSERLAIIEILLPAAIAWSVKEGFDRRHARIAQIMPLVMLGGLVLIFGLLETIRSWGHYDAIYSGNWLRFVLDRLALYYGLAISNGINFILDVPGYLGHLNFSFDWLYKLPFLKEWSWAVSYQEMGEIYWESLKAHGTQEFNNQSGVFAYIYDYGPLSLLAFAVAGYLAERAYRIALSGRVFSRLIYPFVFLAILELLREPFFTSSRMFYTFGALLISQMTLTYYRQADASTVPWLAEPERPAPIMAE